ncbi:PREDICTED: uncharacterized protein LOC105556227, partial [Vollenhovia emeryi]|uniref:uncharacterized protein LOC105556227 n=1 Tax=Vollenhovia emeryi TaxID=411798 RepID=UPI0005F42C4E
MSFLVSVSEGTAGGSCRTAQIETDVSRRAVCSRLLADRVANASRGTGRARADQLISARCDIFIATGHLRTLSFALPSSSRLSFRASFEAVPGIRFGLRRSSAHTKHSLTLTNKHVTYSSNPFPSTDFISTEVIITADSFPEPSTHDTVNNKWLINLSPIQIPPQVQSLLQLAERFCLPVINKNKIIPEVIKSIENNVHRFPIDKREIIRGRSFPIINNIAYHINHTSENERFLLDSVQKTRDFLHDNPNIIVTRADKGHTTVIMERDMYTNKMLTLLNDRETYNIVKKDPTKKLIGSLHELLARWKKMNYIDETTYKGCNFTDGTLPRAYGLPKIHKTGYPLRIIVSSVNTPLHTFSTFLHKIIYSSVPKPDSHILNSFELVNKLNGLHLEQDYDIIPLDVISFFTNVPIDLAIDIIATSHYHLSPLPTCQYIPERIHSNNTFYKQTFGTPMGSPLSPIIADITMQDLEIRALEALTFVPPFYV